MPLDDADRARVESELGRDLTHSEALLFENLWSEHCAYRSSRQLLTAFDSAGEDVVIGPGDDTAVVAVDEETYLTVGIESHNHPSFVDPYDGAATGVGGIVRDTLSMGAYPIALADSIYFGSFDRERSRYLFEGVVEGIGGYGNSIGVPTVAGSTTFHPDYEGNPLVNVACVGITNPDRLVTGTAQSPGNALVILGNATGRDGLGGAAFASDDLSEDAETEDRPAVQVGDPYAEKRLIECNEALVDEELVQSARDLGAAGLGGATAELVGDAGLGARIDLDRVHRREPNMSAPEILLAESQERMCYEVAPDDVARVHELADRYDLGCSVVGRVTTGNYVCTFPTDGLAEDGAAESVPSDTVERVSESGDPDRRVVVDCDPEFLADGAPPNELASIEPTEPASDVPDVDTQAAFETVVSAPSAASKEWVYRQYDHEVGVRTATGPGADAAVLAVREAETGLALSAGAEPHWTTAAPYEGARAVAIENATNLACVGATPLAAVDCLNGGNPENPETYGGFQAVVEGLADGCRAVDAPVVGGNVSLYNDSASGPIPPTPTLAMLGTRPDYEAPGIEFAGDATLLAVGRVASGERDPALGGSQLLASEGGTDRFPGAPTDASERVAAIRTLADRPEVHALHDVSHGGLAVTLAEMAGSAGASVTLDAPPAALFDEGPGRAVVETTDPEATRQAVDAPVTEIGTTDGSGTLDVAVGDDTVRVNSEEVGELRNTIAGELH